MIFLVDTVENAVILPLFGIEARALCAINVSIAKEITKI